MDGSYLAEFLLKKDYEVFGIERQKAREDRLYTQYLEDKITYLKGDLADQNSLVRCIKESQPHEIYNLAGQSFVENSWSTPEVIADTTGVGVLRMLEAIREYGDATIRFYQASSSEMFGKMTENPARETTPFYPRSPYGVAKLYGHWITKSYRESYGMYNCNGILFSHESERRGKQFVTRKISYGVAQIYLGITDSLFLGNIEAERDWGYAPDYVEGMWLMLQQESPDDYVLSTGIMRSIKDFLKEAFEVVGITDWQKYIRKDMKFFRPAEVDVLRGDASKANIKLGWYPKTPFKEWVKKMVDNDIKILKNEKSI